MKRSITFWILALVVVATAATPVNALSIVGCGDFTIFADKDLNFQDGAISLIGNVFLRNPAGKVNVGAHNAIHGTITANKIFLGTGAVVDDCVANSISGPGSCTTQTVGPGSFAPQPACIGTFPPLPLLPVNVPACVNTATAVTVPTGLSQSLLPGCYGALRLNPGSTLTLKGGGVYNFKEVRQLSGSTLRSDSPGWSAVVNVMGKYITESSVFMTDLVVNDQAGPGNNFHIGNGSIIKNVICSSPNGEIHIHTGAQLRGDSALLALTFAVQPITAEAAPTPILCECPDGSHFADDVSRKCVLD